MSKFVLALVASLSLAAAAVAQNGAVEIKHAWARATPGKAETGGVYMTLEAPQGDRLIAAATPAANKAELHTMTMDGGIMKMRPLAELDLPAGKSITLKPGAIHIMLLGLKEPLRAGQSFPLALDFAKAGRREVSVSVEKAGAMAPADGTHGGMTMPMPAHH